MGYLFSVALILVSLASSSIVLIGEAQAIKSARLLDLVIRDYTLRSNEKHSRTGIVRRINLPANLTGIKVDTIRFRCGSLRRYGAKVKEFRLGVGVTVHPCVERVLVVRQYVGENWSSVYYDNYELSGYQLISPVLGLVAYDAGGDMNFSANFEVGIRAGENPITIDFGNSIHTNSRKEFAPICASLERDGKVTLASQISPNVCIARGNGHFGVVVEDESPLMPASKKVSRRKLVVGSLIGAALGALLLGLLVIAMFVKVTKKARMEELERRAYEEEALQVSMVGHVRAPTASFTRTVPIIEHDEYGPPHSLRIV